MGLLRVRFGYDPEDFFCRAQRARAALRATSRRCSAVSFFSRALAPLRPREARYSRKAFGGLPIPRLYVTAEHQATKRLDMLSRSAYTGCEIRGQEVRSK